MDCEGVKCKKVFLLTNLRLHEIVSLSPISFTATRATQGRCVFLTHLTQAIQKKYATDATDAADAIDVTAKTQG